MQTYLRNTALLICDLQKKTIPNLYKAKEVINNVNKLLTIKMVSPVINFAAAAQFIPDKLGMLDRSLHINNIDMIYDKTTYSMVNNELIERLDRNDIKNIILTGMEIQWCINNTLIDLKSLNYNIFIPVDAIGNSLNIKENTYNLENLKTNGAKLLTTDSVIAQTLVHYNDPVSKKYVKILKEK